VNVSESLDGRRTEYGVRTGGSYKEIESLNNQMNSMMRESKTH
jgi:hypothetical protein